MGRILDHVTYRTTVYGLNKVPRTGPVIFAANHLSYLDGPVMVGASNRYMHVLVRDSMFKGFLGRVLRASGQIPIDRSGDRAALQAAKAVLERGDCVGILPEGTRGSGDASSVNSGVAWLALNSGAVVVPVAVLGTRVSGEHRDVIPKLRRHFHVAFGDPLTLEKTPGLSGRAAMDAAAERIQLALADHIRESVKFSGQELPADSSTEENESES
ncbi:lysophospholipid acyltransferase family protein [Psychromicrobium xiongbiense]|uniref:lysophospholipid acyltransferase family protein n=1 Tax=Psychromicrobium xiongbiense TaxID=3051184 RepID=UPI002552774B|nr:lysophospholipid acyltransferase family protein [Psychromicrobium sp. YIM S02556]